MRQWSVPCLLATLLCAAPAAAQSTNLDRFSASETPEDDFQLSRPTDLGRRFGAQIHADYANDPLVFEEQLGDSDSESHRVVANQLVLTAGLALGLFDRLVVYAGLPLTAVMSGDEDSELDAAGIAARPDGGGLGDLYAGARVRLFGEARDRFALGLQLTATFPTAGTQSFRGTESVTLQPKLLGELRFGSARLVLNLGARVRKDEAAADSNLAFADEFTFGIGAAIPLWIAEDDHANHLDLLAQLYGATTFDDAFARESTPIEATIGAKLFHSSGMVLGLATGPGLTRGFGSPDARVIAMIGYVPPPETLATQPDDEDRCPNEPEDEDGFRDDDGCPDPDNDSDGIFDTVDECPMEPEDVDTFEDENGCPDPDNDSDGILDTVDQCPMEPEDVDTFEDENGCPDPDNDGDGVVDDHDACPMEAGPVGNEGCPDADRDADTVVDRLDNCPDEPGPPENQGCRARQRVRIEQGRLEILDVVYFQTNGDRIQPRSFPLLENVAAVLNAHPEIQRIRVEGHTDARGQHDRNIDLSQRRANAVVRFLVDRGQVAEDRLEAQGFGPDRPIVENATTAEEHARNRRVEFNIVGDNAGIEQQNSGPGDDTIDR